MPRLVTFAVVLALVAPLAAIQGGTPPGTGSPGAFAPVTIEAEDGALTRTRVDTTRPGYTGAGYVTGFEDDGSGVAVVFTVPTTGLYALAIRYAADSEKTNDVVVDGQPVGSLYFPPAMEFTTVAAGNVWLQAGDSTVGIRKNWGYFDVDAFELAPAAPRPALSVSDTLVNPDATPEARALMSELVRGYGKRTIAGQGEVDHAEWVATATGTLPTLLGLDMMDYTPSRVERGTTSNAVEQAIDWHERGGIVAFQWHWNAPNGLIDEPGNEWYRGFYTEATTFDVAAALANPAGDDYALLMRDIDAIAVQLLRLQDAGVPVLWRPLHEAQGEWFWWGAKGSGPLLRLYDILFERLTSLHGLDNLIWVWTSEDTPDVLSWYPGDHQVDIIGADIYPATGSHPVSLGMFDRLVELYGGRKMIAMTENGALPDLPGMYEQGAPWAWFMTWDDMIEDAALNPPEVVASTYDHPSVVTLDEWTGQSPATTPAATPAT